MRRLLALVLAALAHANRALKGAWAFVHDAFDEAVEPLVSRLPWLRDRAADAGVALQQGAGYAALGAAAAIELPGAVLGSILPAPAASAQSIADDAVAQDNAVGAAAQNPMFGLFVHAAAQALQTGGEAAFARHSGWISQPVADYLRSLSSRDLAVACKLPPVELHRHVTAERASDASPMLPPFRNFAAEAATPQVSDAEIDTILARAKRLRSGELAEVAAMSRRGVRPISEPTWDNAPSYGPRAAFQ